MLAKEALVKCRVAGKMGDYDEVLVQADNVLSALQTSNSNQERLPSAPSISSRTATTTITTNDTNNQSIVAAVKGYKGFALMKLGQYSAAIPYLEQSKLLRPQNQGNRIHRTRLQERQREIMAVEYALVTCYQQLGSNAPLPSLLKYPRTVHLFDSGGTATTMDDFVVPDLTAVASIWCNGTTSIKIEEKVDGANLGISYCPWTSRVLVQNRSHYLSSQGGEHAQFHRLPEWLAEHREALVSILGDGNQIMYGEWLVARHSIPYQRLPGWFVAFDIYDKSKQRFLSRRKFHSALKGTRIPVVPTIETRCFGPYTRSTVNRFRDELVSLLDTPSTFRTDGGTVEGIVLRMDNDDDDTDTDDSTKAHYYLKDKFKIVRPDFHRGCSDGHWASRPIEKQMVDIQFAEEYLQSCYAFAED